MCVYILWWLWYVCMYSHEKELRKPTRVLEALLLTREAAAIFGLAVKTPTRNFSPLFSILFLGAF